MVITNIYLRVILSAYSILIGIVLLKIHTDKDKDSVWGHLYRIGEKTGSGKIYIIMGWFSIIAGLIAMTFGFRTHV